jgi:hypothetical protein
MPISGELGIIPNLEALFVPPGRLLRDPNKGWTWMTFVTTSG